MHAVTADKYGIQYSPSFVLFNKKQAEVFKGVVNNANDIKQWVYKRSNANIKAISTEAELQRLKNSFKNVFLYIGPINTPFYTKIFITTSSFISEAVFFRAAKDGELEKKFS